MRIGWQVGAWLGLGISWSRFANEACCAGRPFLPVPLLGLALILLSARPVAAQPSGYLWLYSNINGATNTFEKINPTTGGLVQTVSHSSGNTPLPSGGSFSYGGGYLWLYANVGGATDTFEKLDPNTGALIQTVTHSSASAPLPQGGKFAFGGGYLWLYANANGTDTFEKIDPAAGALIQTVTHSANGAPLPMGGSCFSVGGGYLWLYSQHEWRFGYF